MPESIVSNFVILESSNLTENRLRLRFMPDVFDDDHTDPILRIEIDLTAEIDQAAQKVSHIEQGFIDDIEADESSLTIWIENLASPIQFQGAVTWHCEGYATSDYIKAIKAGDRIRQERDGEIVQLQRTIDRAVRFIDRTIDRIEKKQDLTHSQNSDYTEQIQLLRGARRHLADD
jgi:hypothetical protein